MYVTETDLPAKVQKDLPDSVQSAETWIYTVSQQAKPVCKRINAEVDEFAESIERFLAERAPWAQVGMRSERRFVFMDSNREYGLVTEVNLLDAEEMPILDSAWNQMGVELQEMFDAYVAARDADREGFGLLKSWEKDMREAYQRLIECTVITAFREVDWDREDSIFYVRDPSTTMYWKIDANFHTAEYGKSEGSGIPRVTGRLDEHVARAKEEAEIQKANLFFVSNHSHLLTGDLLIQPTLIVCQNMFDEAHEKDEKGLVILGREQRIDELVRRNDVLFEEQFEEEYEEIGVDGIEMSSQQAINE